MNAFVHLSLPDDILVDVEENKVSCAECGKTYLQDTVGDSERGIHIESFIPKDGHCADCGSDNFNHGGDPKSFEEDLRNYRESKDDLLGFYDNFVSNYCS